MLTVHCSRPHQTSISLCFSSSMVYTTLRDSPDLVMNWIEIWTVWRPQIWRNEVWCVSTQNLHSFTGTFTLVLVLQGNEATKLSYSGKFFIHVIITWMKNFPLLWTISFWFRHWKNFKNRPTFAKVTVKIKVAQFFRLTVYYQFKSRCKDDLMISVH